MIYADKKYYADIIFIWRRLFPCNCEIKLVLIS